MPDEWTTSRRAAAKLVGITALVVSWVSLACAQSVQVVVPETVVPVTEPVRVEVRNVGDVAISFCADFGRLEEDDVGRLRPNPFQTEIKRGRRWSTLLMASDLGNQRASLVLDPRGVEQFPIRLNEPGLYRLTLRAVSGRKTLDCPTLHAGFATIRSKPFKVSPPSGKPVPKPGDRNM